MNWHCEYCSSLHDDKVLKCIYCGAPKGEVSFPQNSYNLALVSGISRQQFEAALRARRGKAFTRVLARGFRAQSA